MIMVVGNIYDSSSIDNNCNDTTSYDLDDNDDEEESKAGAWQEWEMKARHLTKAQGSKVLLHAQNTRQCTHYTKLK